MSAVLLLPADADQTEWLKRRRDGIGASEMAAVMGLSPWDSPFSLWWRKHMGWEIEASDEMKVGTFLEPKIAEWFGLTAQTPDMSTHRMTGAGLFASKDRAWQLATPDRLIYRRCSRCGGSVLIRVARAGRHQFSECARCDNGLTTLAVPLECKWVAYSWDGWGESGSGTIPIQYKIQCLQQLDVMETDSTAVCALGPGGFRHFEIRRDEKDLKVMRAQGERFMSALAEGTPPNLDDHVATLTTVKRINENIEDIRQEIPEKLARAFRMARKYKDLAAKTDKRYSLAVRAHMGTAKTAVCQGEEIAYRTVDDKLMRKS